MKNKIFLLSCIGILIVSLTQAQIYRKEFNIPDINGYKTLKCDLHIHTVFSDGYVWPTVRVQEAWMEGLDAIAFTDHIEYRPFKKDVISDHNRAFEIARELGERSNLIVIQGTEITRHKPMGHLNAIFTTDNNAMDVKDSIQAITIANQQKAFVFWNHPNHEYGKWSPVQDNLFQKGLFQGIEVVNSNTYYPDAQQWCMDKNLTMMGTSDVHSLITFDYDLSRNGHRTITLVFAKDRSQAGIKEALIAHRTAICWNNKVIGREEFLQPIFRNSITIADIKLEKNVKGIYSGIMFIKNTSHLFFEIKTSGAANGLSLPEKTTIPPASTVAVPFDYNNPSAGQTKIEFPAEVANFLSAPDKAMRSALFINFDIK